MGAVYLKMLCVCGVLTYSSSDGGCVSEDNSPGDLVMMGAVYLKMTPLLTYF